MGSDSLQPGDSFQNQELQLLRACLSSTNDAILITKAEPLDEPGPEIVYVNPAFEKLTGYSREEAIGKTPRMLQGPDTDRQVLDEIRQALNEGQAIRRELINYTRGGKVYWNELDITPVRDEDGRLTHYVAVQRNVTERKSMEAALRESIRETEDLQEAIDHHAIMAVTAADGTIIYVNDKFCEVSGYSREELIGRSHRIIKSDYHPDSFFREMWETIARGEVWQGDIKNRTKDGNEYWVATTVVPFLDENGKPRSYVAIHNDISRRKMTEERLAFQASLIEKANEAIVVIGPDGRISFWNHGAEVTFGASSAEAVGQDPMDFLNFRGRSWNDALEATRAKGAWSGELAATDPDGQTRCFDSRWTRIASLTGDSESILIISSDVTQEKALENQILRAQRVESVGRLAGGIAHDLNNMLAPIMLSTDNIRNAATVEQREKALSLIEKSVERASSLVRQVLTFSRGMEGERTDLDVKLITREITNIIQETFPKNITLKTDVPDDLWSIVGDPTQIQQVLMNHCVNARDAMEAGGTLQIKAANQILDENYMEMNLEAQVGPYVVISIIDDGIGIEREHLNKIFDPFFTTKETGKGSGIGLSTSLAIVKNHQGFIHAYSEPGKGSTFKLYFPARTGERDDTNQQEAEKSRKLPHGHGETILIVDDEEPILEVTSSALQRFGYKTETAGNGAQAAAIYAKDPGRFDLVLTDMAMPIMDGYALIIALRAIHPDVKIVAASGLASNGGLSKALGAGIKYFISKPYTAETLLKTIRRALDEN